MILLVFVLCCIVAVTVCVVVGSSMLLAAPALTYRGITIYNKPETETDTVGWPRAILRPPETFHSLLF